MTDASNIYQALIASFPNSMEPITNLSRNDAGNKKFICSEILAFNYDTLKVSSIKNSVKEKSPDVLFFQNNTLYFVEFKEGLADKVDVRSKIHEGINTLFHYCMQNNILNRDSFLALNIKYAVVKRPNGRGSQFMALLENSFDYFNLKNLHGLLIKDTTVKWKPESIFKLLNSLSGGAISQIDYFSSDQKHVQTIS